MTSTRNFTFALLGFSLASFSASSQAEWKYQLTPYLWASSLEGTTAVAGQEVDFSADFSDLVSNLDAGIAANFNAQSETWGYFIDGNFVKLSADELGLKSGIDVAVDQKIVEAGISYRLSDQFNLIAGGRYQKVDEDITVPIIGTLNGGDSWIDGFIGGVWQPVNTDKWTLRLRGDIGAGDSDSVWQAGIGGGYRFNKTWSILLAYRYLSTDFESEKFKWDVDQSGLGIGLGISW
ncbi:MAG: outer membrane beta-barrel protein [Arenicellales bacterium]